MDKSISAGLRYSFGVIAIASFIAGLAGMLAPLTVIQFSGLDPKSLPVIQQSGAFVFGFFIAGLMGWRATKWSEVRITVASGAIVALATVVGAFYYVVLQGVATAGLILILIASLLATIILGYFYFRLSSS